MTTGSSPVSRPPNRIRRGMDRLYMIYWHKHRGQGVRPIFDEALECFLSPIFERALLSFAALGAIAPIFSLLTRYPVVTFIGAGGLILDIAGVLMLFKEWVLQFREGERHQFENVDRRVGMSKPEEPFVFEDDGPSPIQVARHLADGLRDRLAQHIMPALIGIVCLVLGFLYQLTSLVLAATLR